MLLAECAFEADSAFHLIKDGPLGRLNTPTLASLEWGTRLYCLFFLGSEPVKCRAASMSF